MLLALENDRAMFSSFSILLVLPFILGMCWIRLMPLICLIFFQICADEVLKSMVEHIFFQERVLAFVISFLTVVRARDASGIRFLVFFGLF